MKASALTLLLFIGVIILLAYGYNKGWFKSFTSTPVINPAPVSNSVSAPLPTGATVIPDQQTISNPDQVQVDHSDSGYVLIPVDSFGNVVQPSKAIQFIRFSSVGQDCAVQYRDRIYVVQYPSRRHHFIPKP